MEDKSPNIFSEVKNSQKFIGEILIISIILSLSINLLTEFFLSPGNLAILIIGIILLVLCITYVLISQLSQKEYNQRVKGFFIYDIEENSIIPIPMHNVSNDMNQYLNSACEEDKAIKLKWNQNPLSKYNSLKEKSRPESMVIIEELVSYIVFSNLTTLVTDYFNTKNEEIQNLTRKDFLNYCENNRFLDLFSKPMEKRISFLKSKDLDSNSLNQIMDNPNSGKTYKLVMAYGKDGAFFNSIDFPLPKGAQIESSKEWIEFNFDVCKLKIKTNFDGYSTNIPNSFLKKFVKIKKDPLSYRDYQFNIDISIHFRRFKLLFSRNWRKFAWIENFLSNLEKNFSLEKFLTRISWDTLQALDIINND